MKYTIEFSSEAQKAVKKYKKSNPYAYKKLYNLLPELENHPRTGSGHPEPMRFGNDQRYSRRLSAKDRVVYDIYDDTIEVLIIQVDGHYSDK